jgi:predicted Holliday junction resolvase-like endonuclease
MEFLQLLSLLTPILTLAFYIGLVHQRIKSIATSLAALLQEERTCRAVREETENELRKEVATAKERVAQLQGRLNGHAHA